jgi:hypothetical protein
MSAAGVSPFPVMRVVSTLAVFACFATVLTQKPGTGHGSLRLAADTIINSDKGFAGVGYEQVIRNFVPDLPRGGSYPQYA